MDGGCRVTRHLRPVHVCLVTQGRQLTQAGPLHAGRPRFRPPFCPIPNDTWLAVVELALVKVAFIEVEAFGKMSSFTFDIR